MFERWISISLQPLVAERNRGSMKEKPHIMIVDDNISICNSMSLILGHKGYAVTTAKDGFEAIKKDRENSFDLIFMDVKMPGMNGVETYRKIKQTRQDAVVIMMTAYAVKELVDEALQEGAYRAFHKPLDMEVVLRMVDEILEEKQTGDLTDTAPNVLENKGTRFFVEFKRK